MLVIGAMIFALVIPVVGRVPAKVEIRRARTDLEAAFSTASRRARATGGTVGLTLQLAEGKARVQDGGSGLGGQGGGDALATAEPESGGLAMDLPGGIEWPEGGGDEAVYIFLPGGQASGPVLNFSLRGREFVLAVDNLTGRLLIDQTDE